MLYQRWGDWYRPQIDLVTFTVPEIIAAAPGILVVLEWTCESKYPDTVCIQPILVSA
jgi:hypothetical protein